MSARTARSMASGAAMAPPTPTPGPSTQRTSTSSTATASSRSIPLPEYQAPSFPLTGAARDQLRLLLNNYPAEALNKSITTACTTLTDRAGDIADSKNDLQETARKKRQRRERDGEPVDEEAETYLKEYDQKVDGLTTRLETWIRRAIDGQAGIEALQNALKAAHKDSATTSSQRQQTQRTQASTQDATAPGNTNVEDEAATPPPPPQIKESFETAHQQHVDYYASKSETQRYAHHPAYTQFKRTVWEAQHPDNTPVPHPSTWFISGGDGPQPGVTGTADDDDDMVIANANISTKCPLTLLPFKDPVTSRKCEHTFERSAFEQLWAARPTTQGEGPRRKPLTGVQCPVCPLRLEKNDVESDPVVVRRVRRMQAIEKARAERNEPGGSGSGDEEASSRNTQNRTQTIDSESESEEADIVDDVDAVVGEERSASARRMTPAIKKEKMRQRSRSGIDDIEEVEDDD